jgi:amino acid transporter
MTDHPKPAAPAGFGTFGGVFTPCVLTILGVIMFLRFGQVVGQAGLIQCLIIIAVAKTITVLTAISLSATATNTRVKGGGAYFLISRSLGVEYGGAIGLVFFVAQAVSVAMYVVGFTEAFLAAFPQWQWSPRIVGTVVNLVVFVCVYIGAGWTIRMQYGILALLVLSLVSFGAGALPQASLATLEGNLGSNYLQGSGFFIMFALFFPAVTGIMAGANMSGDLSDPARSIPRGTLAAIAATGAVYVTMAVLLAASKPSGVLTGDAYVVQSVSRWPMLITAGVFAATLSSALGSMMGAPRILQALAKDGIFGSLRPFARGEGRNNEPRRAILLSLVIAQAGVMLGDLDLIAPVITMFFMITYGTLNLACFYEAFTGNPSFRPTFRFSHWSLALAGALSCLAVMLMIDLVWALVSIAAIAGLHWYVSRKEIRTRWGDVQSGYAYERARKALLRLEEERYHPKNWRPSILAVRWGKWEQHHRGAEYAGWLGGEYGVVTLGEVLAGDVENRLVQRREEEDRLRGYIRDEELNAFSAVVVEKNQAEGIKSLLQSYGVGGFRPNTLLVVWEERDKVNRIAAAVELGRAFERSVVAVRPISDHPRWRAPLGPIDVWWRGKKNGALMLTFAHVLKGTGAWRERPIRLFHAVADEGQRDAALEMLNELITVARVSALPQVVVTDDLATTVHTTSVVAGVVFLGLDPPEPAQLEAWHSELAHLMDGLGDVILVSNAGDVALEA